MEEHNEKEGDKEKLIQWQAPEFIHHEKSTLWYLATGTIILLGSLNAYLLNNIMLSAIILIGGTSMLGLANKKPKMTSYRINWRGVTIDKTMHRFYEFVSYNYSLQ